MTMEPDLELLEMTHHVVALSIDGQNTLKKHLALAQNSTTVVLPVEFAAALLSVLAIQTKMVVGLTEQNQQIVDHVNKLVERYDKK